MSGVLVQRFRNHRLPSVKSNRIRNTAEGDRITEHDVLYGNRVLPTSVHAEPSSAKQLGANQSTTSFGNKTSYNGFPNTLASKP